MNYPYWWYYLTWNMWNNIFTYDYDINQKLRIPELKETSYESIKKNGIPLWREIVFSEKHNESKEEYTWLKNALFFLFNGIPTYIFDNHNHAFAFWRREVLKGNIKKNNYLVHIDQHSDMNENNFQLKDEKRETICNFSNTQCNVWNFIKPAINSWLIADIQQIRTERSLFDYEIPKREYILDIDLDFWDPLMWIEKKENTYQKVRLLMQSAKIITIATSPYFLNQQLALRLISELFKFSL